MVMHLLDPNFTFLDGIHLYGPAAGTAIAALGYIARSPWLMALGVFIFLTPVFILGGMAAPHVVIALAAAALLRKERPGACILLLIVTAVAWEGFLAFIWDNMPE